MTNKEKAAEVLDIMLDWDSESVINILSSYISDKSLANLYDTLVKEGIID